MKFVITFSSALAIASLLAAPASAASIQFKDAKVEIEAPEGWKSEQDGDTVTLKPGDNAASVVFTLLPAGVEEKAIEELDKSLEKALGQVDWKENPQEIKINGMDARFYEGSAKGGELEVDAMYVNTPANRSLGIYYFLSKEGAAKYGKDLETIVRNIKPIGPADGEVTVLFKNDTTEPVEVFWLDEGKETSYGTIEPGKSEDQSSYEKHTWVFKSGGKKVAEYVATGAEKQEFSITAPK